MKLFRSILLTTNIIVVMLALGCVSHKPPPAIIHADNYTAETPQAQQAVPPGDRILGIKEAIRIGLTNNPTYKQKHLAIVSAWAVFYSQLAGYSPNLNITFGAAQNQWTSAATVGSGSPGGINSSPNVKWSGNLATTWNVFNGLQTTMDTLAARATALSKEELEKDYRRQLIYKITYAYNAILFAKAQIQIDLSNEAYNEQQLRDGQLKYNAGASSLSALLNFKIGKANAQDNVITGATAYKVYRYVLAALMGLTTADLPESTQFPPIQVAENEEYALGVEFYLDMAIAQRPDLKSTKLELESLKYNLYSTWGAFSPTADLSMNYGYNTTKNGHEGRWVPRGNDLNFDYGFNASWVVWKGGARIANVRNAQAQLASKEEGLMYNWITVVKEVRQAYTNLLANVAHRKLLRKIMAMTLKRRDLVREEYNAGNIDIATLNQAQDLLVKAESNHIRSVIGVSNSRAELNEACGLNVVE